MISTSGLPCEFSPKSFEIPTPAVPYPMTPDRSSNTPPSFLIIDDDPVAIKLLREALKKEGRVLFATNGPDGLAQARDHHPDLVLLDAVMPGMDGFEVCAALKADPATIDIPVIFVTSFNDVDHEAKALNAGAVDFISKPISPLVVTLRVRTHLTLRRQADELRQLSRIDGLTGVANRRWFDELLETEWLRAVRLRTPIGLLMVDVDYFKAYNDHYGHTAGDGCLKGVVDAIVSVVRKPPDAVARYGGEEFVCILPGNDLAGTALVGQRVLDEIRSRRLPHTFSGIADIVTVSIGGTSLAPEADQTPNVLVEVADRYLYRAKGEGRNRLVIDSATSFDSPQDMASVPPAPD
ncbi:two-component system, chemotaxis family, response regulator WspR [Gammaproteobacteria bacterium]